MKVTCQNSECSRDFNVPEEKLPNKPVKIACPHCKVPTVVTPPAVQTKPANSPSPANSGSNDQVMAALEERLASFKNEIMGEIGRMVPGGTTMDGGYGGDLKSRVAPEVSSGVKKALICDDDEMVRELLKNSVTNLGYLAQETSTLEESLKILEKPEIDYGLMLIDKVFPGDPEGGFKILSKIATLPLGVRRKIFVVLVSADIRSGDASAAFLMGANTVVNKKDLSRLTDILRSEISNYERLYEAFNRCLMHS